MDERVDVLIVGGGVMGSAIGRALAASTFAGRVAIVERDPSYQLATTPRSAGGVRLQFSTPENIHLSRVTVDLLRRLASSPDGGADLGFREQGYLILATAEGVPVLERNWKVQRDAGAATELFGPDALRERFSWLATEGIAAGAFGPSGEGWIDPVALLTLLRGQARAGGVEVIHDEVVALERSGDRIGAARLASGRRIACGTLVVAAGPQSGAVAALAEVPLPVEPRKRFVYVFSCRDVPAGLAGAPLTVDPSGVWFRPEGAVFIAGLSPHEDEEPVHDDLDQIDYLFFEERIWPVLAHRVPAFEAIKPQRAWAGFYDYNTLDQNAVIGRVPDVLNMMVCTGFSGHGLQQAVGAGRAIAELIVDGRFTSLDLTRLGYERIARGEPLLELNVI